MESVRVQRWSSAVDVGFWHELKSLKLDRLQLDETPVDIEGEYYMPQHNAVPALMNIAFQHNRALLYAPGTLINLNTEQRFNNVQHQILLEQYGTRLLQDIKSGIAVQQPSRLNQFIMLTFADLKSHKFQYWFAFPVIKNLKLLCDPNRVRKVELELDHVQRTQFYESLLSWKNDCVENKKE